MPSLPRAVRLDASGLTLAFDLHGGQARLIYVGPELPAHEDLEALASVLARGRHESQPCEAIPASLVLQQGRGWLGEPSVSLFQSGVALTTDFRLQSTQTEAAECVFTFVDTRLEMDLVLMWHIADSSAVETKARLVNRSSKAVAIDWLASLAVSLPSWATHATRFSGRWAGEMREERLPISAGQSGGESRRGRPGFGGANWIRVEEECSTWDAGRVLGAHLAWSGDHQLSLERNADGETLLMLGERLDRGEVQLAPGEAHETPVAVFALSSDGLNGLAQSFHRHVLARSPASGPRKVHLNSWEALGFGLDLPGLKTLAGNAAALGVERFVLDDGWFKGRRNDRSSLGDWMVDPQIFPDGLAPLITHIESLGMDFGLWVEPEMVSPDSDLYRAHPDWCLHLESYPRATQRQQLVLDIARAEVADHIFAALDRLLTDNRIAYLKWDHNRELFPLAGKGRMQVLAYYALLDRLRTAHPTVEIESCASGGGRVDLELLSRCARFWASDNNDAIERLRINRSWFQFLPLAITGNHVGPHPNPITGRSLAMDFRAKVSLFGHMGVEADPAAMNAAELETLSGIIALYKEWRDVLHGGTLFALDFAEPGLFGWFAIKDGRGTALAAQTQFAAAYDVAPIRLPGLVPDQLYRVTLLEPWPSKARHYLANSDQWKKGLLLSGRALGEAGVALPLAHPETAWLVAVELAP